MSILKKINRGALLTLILLLGVIIYLIALSAVQSREKPRIEEICRQYVAAEVAYSLLPADYRTEGIAVPEEELGDYIQEMETAIRPFYLDNEKVVSLALDRLADNLRNQAEKGNRLLLFEKEIKDFSSFEFDGNKATVRFRSLTTVERNGGSPGMNPEARLTGETDDRIVLQKVDGQWQIVFAELVMFTDRYDPYSYKD